ncbi:MAG: hypothetical protein ACKODT_07140 [Fluviibacter sp.]
MADYIVSPPIEKKIPVTRGCDRAFTIQRTDTDGSSLDFPAGVSVYMWIDIDPANPLKVDAVVNGSYAAFFLDSQVCDQVKSTRWRIVLDQGNLETPVMIGRFERHDG